MPILIEYDAYSKHTISVEPAEVTPTIVITWIANTTYRASDAEHIIASLGIDAALTLAGMLKTAANIADNRK